MPFQSGAVCRPKDGQVVCGDTYLIHPSDDGKLFVAVIDGLGGGEEAARAAELAKGVYVEHPSAPLQELIRRSHTATLHTRGAVVALMRLDERTRHVAYVGVGNIGTYVYTHQPIKPISKNGILGYRLPQLLELSYSYDVGDVFVMFSDGVTSQFSQDARLDSRQPPQALAEHILATYGKSIDDATVVVIKTTPQP